MCQLLAIIGASLLCFYIALAIFFIAAAAIIAYGNIQYMHPTGVFIGGVWICIPAIYAADSDLAMAFLTSNAPITVAVLVVADYISIPPYQWLWAILISAQALYFAASMGTWGIVAIAMICVVVAPSMALLLLWVCVLVCAYTMAC